MPQIKYCSLARIGGVANAAHVIWRFGLAGKPHFKSSVLLDDGGSANILVFPVIAVKDKYVFFAFNKIYTIAADSVSYSNSPAGAGPARRHDGGIEKIELAAC